MSTWTTNDIQMLSKFYTQGLAIKEIAKALDRTPSALHKAIARFNLQAIKNTKKMNSFGYAINENGLPVAMSENNMGRSYLKKLFGKCMNEEWVNIEVVIEYLRCKKIEVTFLNQYNKDKEALYALNRKVFVASQVLLVANKLRVEEKKSPFKVHNVSF